METTTQAASFPLGLPIGIDLLFLMENPTDNIYLESKLINTFPLQEFFGLEKSILKHV